MKAKRVIIGSLSLLLLMSGTYVCQRGGDFSSLSTAFASGGGTGGGIRQMASSLWMTMVNTELGIPPGGSVDADGRRLGPDGQPLTDFSATEGDPNAARYPLGPDGNPIPGAAPIPGSTHGNTSSTSMGPGGILGWLFGSRDKDAGARSSNASGSDGGLASNSNGAATSPDGTPIPGTLPAPVPGSTHGNTSSTSIGPGAVIAWLFGDRDDKAGARSGNASGSEAGLASNSNGAATSPDGTPIPGATPAPVPGSAYGNTSSTSMGPGGILGWIFGKRDSNGSQAGSSGSPQPAPMPGAAPVPGSTHGNTSSTSIGPGAVIAWLFGGDKSDQANSDKDGVNGQSSASAASDGVNGDSANPSSFEPGGTFDRVGDATFMEGQSAMPGAPGMSGAGQDGTEIAQVDGSGQNQLAMGQQGASNQPIPRSGDFAARMRDRENIIERHAPRMGQIGFPVSVKDARALSFAGFLGKTHRAHSNWYRHRADLIAEYNRARARDRAAIAQSFRAAQARDRRDGGQAHLRKFMNDSRAFNRQRAAQNGRFQGLLDKTGARIGQRFQYLFHLSLRRHIAKQEQNSPDQAEWRRLKTQAMASMGGIYADRRVPAASQGVNRGVRNYMRHWVAFFYNKKIRDAAEPDEPAPERRREADPVIEQEEVVEKFKPKENCGPTDLHTYSLTRMRKFVKSLESNCRAANGLPDLLLKECHPYHVQMDLKVACKRDIYFFLKFDSENKYDRNRGIDHFNDGCRPYRSVGDLAQTLTNDPNRGIDSLQKQKLNNMLGTMRSCSPGSVSPPPVRRPVAPKPSSPTPSPSVRPAPTDSAPTPAEEPKSPETVPEDMPGKEPESAPEVESMNEAAETVEPATESMSEPEDDEPSAEEVLGIPE